MPIYIIKDADGAEINIINADLDFVEANFDNFEEYTPEVPVVTEEQRIEQANAFELEWRNSELTRTDILMTVPDYPYVTELTAYRQALRDWPSSEDFPNIRPELGV